jgi:hypothetical protein
VLYGALVSTVVLFERLLHFEIVRGHLLVRALIEHPRSISAQAPRTEVPFALQSRHPDWC